MCDASSMGQAGMGASAGGGVLSGVSQIIDGNAKARYYDFLAEQADSNATLAKINGQMQVKGIQDQAAADTKQLLDQQKRFNAGQHANMAANGVDAGSVTAQDIAADTLSREKLDELTIRYNADHAATAANLNSFAQQMNLKNEALANRVGASNASAAGWTSGMGTLLGTAGSVSSQWAAGKKQGLWGK